MITDPTDNMLRKFSELGRGDDFISPEGSLCTKHNQTTAVMKDNEDSAYKYGDIVPFGQDEVVEFCPK